MRRHAPSKSTVNYRSNRPKAMIHYHCTNYDASQSARIQRLNTIGPTILLVKLTNIRSAGVAVLPITFSREAVVGC